MSVTLASALPRPTVMVVSSKKAPSRSSPISMTLSGGEPLTVSTLPVHLTFFGSVRPKVDSQLCWAPVMVPHPASEIIAQPAMTRRNADLTYLGLGIFRPMLAIIHDVRRIGPESIGSGSDVGIPVAVLPRSARVRGRFSPGTSLDARSQPLGSGVLPRPQRVTQHPYD